MKASRLVILSVLLGAAVNIANASLMQWNLSTLSFDSGGGGPTLALGGTASGSFTYDANTNTFSDWNILVSGFGVGFNQGNALATPATSSIQTAFFGSLGPPGPASVGLSYSSDQALLWLGFTPGLTNSGGVVGVNATILDSGNAYYSWYASGGATASSAAVPEPATALLCLSAIGFGVLSLSFRQRRCSK